MNSKHADLDAAWDDYRKNVVPSHAGTTQLEETRKAFYAGAGTICGFMGDWAENDVPPLEGAAALKSLDKQLERFLDTLPQCNDPECEACSEGRLH